MFIKSDESRRERERVSFSPSPCTPIFIRNIGKKNSPPPFLVARPSGWRKWQSLLLQLRPNQHSCLRRSGLRERLREAALGLR